MSESDLFIFGCYRVTPLVVEDQPGDDDEQERYPGEKPARTEEVEEEMANEVIQQDASDYQRPPEQDAFQ